MSLNFFGIVSRGAYTGPATTALERAILAISYGLLTVAGVPVTVEVIRGVIVSFTSLAPGLAFTSLAPGVTLSAYQPTVDMEDI